MAYMLTNKNLPLSPARPPSPAREDAKRSDRSGRAIGRPIRAGDGGSRLSRVRGRTCAPAC